MIRLRRAVPQPPRGSARLTWYGPGLLWMLSSVGTGSILFTPRVGSQYGYELYWLMLLVVLFMWTMIKETARYTTMTGRSFLEGIHALPGPRNWAVWLLFVPQLLAAAVGIAGLSAIVGSAFAGVLPGNATIYGLLTVLMCTTVTTVGRYQLVERLSIFMALLLVLLALTAAWLVFPGGMQLLGGLTPQWPESADLYIIQPWVGTILAGSMGIIWFSYWTSTRGFAGGLKGPEKEQEQSRDLVEEQRRSQSASHSRSHKYLRLRSWFRLLSRTALLGVFSGTLVLTAFLVLGAELLAPQGILPQGTDVAMDLTHLFADVWGSAGRWMLLVAIVVALVGSVFANQDGWGRAFADITLILVRGRRRAERPGLAVGALRWLEDALGADMFARINLKKLYIATVTGLVPALIILAFEDPVAIMSASGIIAAAHTPFIVALALLLNFTALPRSVQAGLVDLGLLCAAGLFYLGFAVLYFVDGM